MSGWVKLHRSVWGHPAFAKDPMSEREAWLWLVSAAAHAPTQHRVGARIVDVPRGTLFVTLRGLAAEWRWKSVKRVRTFLAMLENESMIGTETGTGKTHITICNYEKFQAAGHPEETRGAHAGHTRGTLNKKGRIKEDKNTPLTPRKRGDGDPPEFEAFWSAYPRKVGKGAARKAWAKAAAKADTATLLAAAKRVEDRGQYTPHPATWLNQERWLDQPNGSGGDDYLAAHGIRDLDGGDHDGGGNFSGPQRASRAWGHRADDMSSLFPAPEKETRPVPQREYVQ